MIFPWPLWSHNFIHHTSYIQTEVHIPKVHIIVMTHIYQTQKCAHKSCHKEGCWPQDGVKGHLCAVAACMNSHGWGELCMGHGLHWFQIARCSAACHKVHATVWEWHRAVAVMCEGAVVAEALEWEIYIFIDLCWCTQFNTPVLSEIYLEKCSMKNIYWLLHLVNFVSCGFYATVAYWSVIRWVWEYTLPLLQSYGTH